MLRLARDRFAARAQAPSSEPFALGPIFNPGLDRVEPPGVRDQAARADARQIVGDRPAVEIGEAGSAEAIVSGMIIAPAVIASEAKQSRDHGALPVAPWIATLASALLAMTAWRMRLAIRHREAP